jgi:hypothetical protein
MKIYCLEVASYLKVYINAYVMYSLDQNALEYVILNSGVYLTYGINYLTKQNIDS